MKFKGTFLDEISHDIPHQNWGEAEWDKDFGYMKAAGIDTVILIRSGYRRWQTFPSEVLTRREGCYTPPVDLVDMFLRLSDKWGMKFFFGLYDSGKYWDRGDYAAEVELNKEVIDEVWKKIWPFCLFWRMVHLSGVQQKDRKDSRPLRQPRQILQRGFGRSAYNDIAIH
jgi:hypothetical protein